MGCFIRRKVVELTKKQENPVTSPAFNFYEKTVLFGYHSGAVGLSDIVSNKRLLRLKGHSN